jgi:hypothetical protein
MKLMLNRNCFCGNDSLIWSAENDEDINSKYIVRGKRYDTADKQTESNITLFLWATHFQDKIQEVATLPPPSSNIIVLWVASTKDIDLFTGTWGCKVLYVF